MTQRDFVAAIERFRHCCQDHPLVVAAFLGGSYAAGSAQESSDVDLYLVTREEDYAAFVAERERFIFSWGRPTWSEDVWDFEGLGFDMIRFKMDDGVWGELALGHTGNFMRLHGGPHRTLVDKIGLLEGVSFPLL